VVTILINYKRLRKKEAYFLAWIKVVDFFVPTGEKKKKEEGFRRITNFFF